jgi:hypothetical protein
MTTFDYRRSLEREDWMKLAGAAAGAGLAVATVVVYFGRLWMQRVPLPRGADPSLPATNLGTVKRIEPRPHAASEPR